MRMRFSALCALLPLGFSSVAAADVLPPQAPWVVDFADAQCIASRNFGSHDDPLYLVVKAPAVGDVLQIGITRSGYIAGAAQMDGEIVFDEEPVPASLLEFGVKKDVRTVVLAKLPRSQLVPMRAASSIRIHAREGQRPDIERGSRILQTTASSVDYRFKVTQIPALLQMLDDCAANLRKVWNVEEGDGPPTLVREKPSGDLRSLFSPDDYPAMAQRRAQMGSIRIAILVNEKGMVSDCTVIETSGVASLDAQSCAVIMQRAELKPAVGLDGKAAKGALVQTIRWMLED